jgi:ABC-type Na+ transport system ATPase subunit NatA
MGISSIVPHDWVPVAIAVVVATAVVDAAVVVVVDDDVVGADIGAASVIDDPVVHDVESLLLMLYSW